MSESRMRIAALYDIHGNVPALDAVVVRLGKTPEDRSAELERWRRSVVNRLAKAAC